MIYFKPRGIPMRQLTEVYLALEGFEALRLADLEGLKHETAAAQMNVSRQTFGRILAQARQCVTEALVNGYALRISGGDYVVANSNERSKRSRHANKPGNVTVNSKELGVIAEKESQQRIVKMEKIAVSAESPHLDDFIDPRFGRAAGFLIVDPQTLEHDYLDNGEAQVRSQGAGIQAAETVARAGVKVVLTGYVGPKAFQALQAAGITIGQDLEGLTIREAIQRYVDGNIELATEPNERGHGR
jgi:predicted DNA-binding protein (UPF0251 family)/predicted Fe-Mo cluster-binding NifX family protein